jgi:hypothetical protein
VPFYPAADHDVQPAPVPAGVACRCCPGGISRSTRPRCYPSDMTEAEWAVCEPLLPAPAWLAGRGGRPVTRCLRDIDRRDPLPHPQRAGVAGAAGRLPARLDGVLVGG